MTAPVCRYECTDALSFLATVDPASVDLVLCDPPFGSTQNDWDSRIPLPELWAALWRVVKPRGSVALFADLRFASALIESQPQHFLWDYVWSKNTRTGHLSAKHRPMRAHEHVLVFSRVRRPHYEPQKSPGKPYRNKGGGNQSSNYGRDTRPGTTNTTGDRHPCTVLEFRSVPAADPSRFHPTQKPTDLLAWLIRTLSPPGGAVLDFAAGSCSTGVAALSEGRSFYGCELSPEYFSAAPAVVIDHCSITPSLEESP